MQHGTYTFLQQEILDLSCSFTMHEYWNGLNVIQHVDSKENADIMEQDSIRLVNLSQM
jgi:hypothetical protein